MRLLRLLTLALLLSFVPGPHARAAGRLDVPYEMFRLPNGLTVIVHEDRRLPMVSVNTWYHVGSAREVPGRTGFAHLFEHLMFNGSKNVPQGAFDQWLEAVGGDNNGSTTTDRTNYWENLPSNALETALFLESDRMGWLLDTMSPERVDQQRDVVKNERRQSYENRPYGMASIEILKALYPPDHPYHWPVIGSQEDLSAASHEDVADFFRKWYGPANTSVVIAGDVDVATAKKLAGKWFGEIPPSEPVEPLAPSPVVLREERRLVLEDKVELPRLYLVWPTPPVYSPSDAALDAAAGVLATGKNSRLYRRLVYELQIAQDVWVYQQSAALASTFNVVVTARAGQSLEKIRAIVDEELARLAAEPPAPREVERFRNQLEATTYARLERIGGFGGKADQLNAYWAGTGNPGFFEGDLARYRALAPADVRAAAFRFLGPGRVVLSVVPAGKTDLAVPLTPEVSK
ncbi:MAG: insulinase family protein [Thermoanaerobaculia bacterium]|nr:insulinase family protein [Thermoanaerobaculia bacterium]